VNQHNCVYWSSENPKIYVNKAMNLPGFSVWCVVGPFFYEGTVTDVAYCNMLQKSIVPTNHQLYCDEDTWYQQDREPPLYHYPTDG
jgi:hypothetical protein